MTTKQELRKFALKQRNILALNGSINTSSSRIVSKILSSDEFQRAENIALYYPIKNEINLLGLLNVEGKNFFFPRCNNLDLEFIKYTNDNNLTTGDFGIIEPKGEKINPSVLDIIYIPALLANKNNYRLGYGKGYYDRFFSKNQGIKAKKIIIVSKTLISNDFKEDKFDVKCDSIISD